MAKRTSSSRFYHILAIIFLSSLLAGLGVLALFWNYLAAYEQSTPRHTGEQLLELYRAGRYGEVMEQAGVEKDTFFDEGQYAAYVKQNLGDFYKVRVAEGSLRDGRRTVLLRGEGGGSITFLLSEQEHALPYGLSVWLPEEEEIPLWKIKIRAPEGVTVTVNGKPLGEEYRISLEPADGFPMPEDSSLAPMEAVYRVEGLAVSPDLGIEGRNAGEYQLTRKGDEWVFSLRPLESGEYEDAARKVAKAYARFISRDAELSEIQAYLYPGTELYNALEHYSNVWYNSHDGVEFENLWVENLVEYSSKCFSAEVAFDYLVYRGTVNNHWQEWRYPTRYRVYLIRTDGGWKAQEIRGIS